MLQGDLMITKWYVKVSIPNPNIEPKYRALYEICEEEGHIRVANEEHLNDLQVNEIMFFDTYKQAKDFATNLCAKYGYFTQVTEYVS
jgi:hypothetical protein